MPLRRPAAGPEGISETGLTRTCLKGWRRCLRQKYVTKQKTVGGNEATSTQCTANTRPSNTYAEVVSADTPRVVRPKAGVQHINVQIQTSPRRDKIQGKVPGLPLIGR